MKTVSGFSYLAISMALSAGILSCSDDGGGCSPDEFYEITIDNQPHSSRVLSVETYDDTSIETETDEDSNSEIEKKINTLVFFEYQTEGFFIEIGLNHFKLENDLKEAPKGTYKIVQTEDKLGNQLIDAKNFDLVVGIREEKTETLDETYVLETGSHSVYDIRDLCEDKHYKNRYEISGGFSFNFRNTHTDKITEVNGEYTVVCNPL